MKTFLRKKTLSKKHRNVGTVLKCFQIKLLLFLTPVLLKAPQRSNGFGIKIIPKEGNPLF